MLQKVRQCVPTDVAVAQVLGQQAGADFLSSMDWHDSHPAISMPKHVVPSFDANNLKALSPKRGH
jgi:hypothetical protein